MEKAHDISVDEPSVAHQAILFVLDVLIRSGQEMEIENLYNTFGDPAFTPQMLRAVGGNEQGLRNFLQRYPSLFTINGQSVRANNGASQVPAGSFSINRSNFKSMGFGRPGGIRQDPINDAVQKWDTKTMKEIEQEAIAFFKKQMAKKEEEWLPIVSVAGHASQASPEIRKFVGPQNEFIHFLTRYPDVFLVREEYCGLKGKADKPGVRFPPPSPPPKRRLSDNSLVSRSTSFNKAVTGGRNFNGSSQNAVSTVQLQLSPLEVKSVHYLMRLLHRCGRMLVQNVPTLLSRAPEPIARTIGQTKDELVQFFKRHSAIFQLHPDSCVSVKSDAVRALIHKDKSFTENSVFTSSGIVLRIFPKYGIVNMENNEQVFFDIQSCQFESFGDLTCILHPGDRLWFNAILGPKDGSTKWRSLKTWIKMKPQNKLQGSMKNVSGPCCSTTGNSSACDLESISPSKQSANSQDSHSCSSSTNLSISCGGNSVLMNDMADGELDQYQLADNGDSSDESLFAQSTTMNGNNTIDCNNCLASKVEAARSTSMMDLRAVACALPIVSSPQANRLSFFPIGRSPPCCGHIGGCKGHAFKSVQRRTARPVSEALNCNNYFSGCIDPCTIRSQVYSTVEGNDISSTTVVDDCHVSVAAQTISSGEILGTNIYIE